MPPGGLGWVEDLLLHPATGGWAKPSAGRFRGGISACGNLSGDGKQSCREVGLILSTFFNLKILFIYF